MQCEAIRPVIRQFLDDLLDEKDYQDVQSHLSGCDHCHAYASSVGTLAYRLYEMGQVTLPPDMLSTILYELKKSVPAKETPAPPAHPQSSELSSAGAFDARNSPYWIAIVLLAVFSVAATTAAFLWKSKNPPGVSLKPQTSQDSALPALTPERLAEGHYHLSLSSRPELAQIILDLELAVERDMDRSLIFLVPVEKSADFRMRLESINGVVKEFGESADAQQAAVSQRVTVYFE